MKTILTFFFITLFTQHVAAQALYVDSTRFITGNKPTTSINYAIPTSDKGILFVGSDGSNPGGIIPYFPVDTVLTNVFIGKIDSNQHVSWLKVYGGTDDDGAASVCQTPDGGYVVLASTGSDNGDVRGYRGGGDFWLLRIDANGNLLWEHTYGSSESEVPFSIACTPDGGFIMAGATDGSDGDVPFHYGAPYTFDWLVIKTDSAGNVQWSKDLGSSNDEGQSGAILSIDSSYYLISNTGSLDHDCTDTAWHPGVHTGYDLYILKLDDTGKVLWDSSYGGTGTDGANCALYDTKDSTIVINGFTYSGDYMVTGYQGGGDMWVVKVKKDGTLLWEKALGSPYEDYGTGICKAYNDGYLAYGWTHNGSIGQEYLSIFSLSNGGDDLNTKMFGGPVLTGNESNSILPYLNGYAATGLSGAYSFTEGTTYGNFDTSTMNPDGGGAFISYLDTGMNVTVRQLRGIKNDLLVYPNPANDDVFIHASGVGAQITVINELGQTMLQEKIFYATTKIAVVDWTSGVYFVQWISLDGEVQTGKFIKQ